MGIREVLLAGTALVLAASLGGRAEAQLKTVYVAAYGGSFEQTMRLSGLLSVEFDPFVDLKVVREGFLRTRIHRSVYR